MGTWSGRLQCKLQMTSAHRERECAVERVPGVPDYKGQNRLGDHDAYDTFSDDTGTFEVHIKPYRVFHFARVQRALLLPAINGVRDREGLL